MSEQFEMSPQGSTSNLEPNLSELKREVEVSPSTLKEITSRQEFIHRVIELTNNSKESIQVGRIKEALVYLNEGEKILEYAASCGKTIDRNIIICVLHNEACCYQKSWELEKCSNYLEALIYNFNSYLKPQDRQTTPSSGFNQSTKQKIDLQVNGKEMSEAECDDLERKTFLARYYLQFCAVNSQMENHSGALIAGRKAIHILKQVFMDLKKISPSKKAHYEKKSEFEQKAKVIDLVSRLTDAALSLAHYDSMLQACTHYLQIWKTHTHHNDKSDRNYVLEEEYRNYSIGNAMQIIPMLHRDFQERHLKVYSSKAVIEKVLLLALGYFTISTELRLMACKKMKENVGEKHSMEFKESEVYHLLSIIIVAACIPFEILYMKHILSSFQSHYGQNLLTLDFEAKLTPEQIESFIFPSLQSNPNESHQHSNPDINQESAISSKVEQPLQSSLHQTLNQQKPKDFYFKQPINDKLQIKKTKIKNINKSKSKSKSMRSLGILQMGWSSKKGEEKAEKISPVAKSPELHLKSPQSKNNLMKIKTSYRFKVSTEKIISTKDIAKETKPKKKKEPRPHHIDFDYFIDKSKDIKQIKKAVQFGIGLISPRQNGSKSSSRRESPVPKYLDNHTKANNKINVKNAKKEPPISKGNFHQYYC